MTLDSAIGARSLSGKLFRMATGDAGHFDIREWGGQHGPSTRWSWRLITAAGQTAAVCGRDFDTEEDAEAAIDGLRRHVGQSPSRIAAANEGYGSGSGFTISGVGPLWSWWLAIDGKVVAHSPGSYDSRADAEAIVEWVRKHAPAVPIRVAEAPPGEKGHPRHGRRWTGQSGA